VKKLSSALLLAILNLLAVLVPVSAQQLAPPNETAQAGAPLPPRIERVPTPATRLHMGMTEADVEQTKGAVAEVATSENAGVKITCSNTGSRRSLPKSRFPTAAFQASRSTSPPLMTASCPLTVDRCGPECTGRPCCGCWERPPRTASTRASV